MYERFCVKMFVCKSNRRLCSSTLSGHPSSSCSPNSVSTLKGSYGRCEVVLDQGAHSGRWHLSGKFPLNFRIKWLL